MSLDLAIGIVVLLWAIALGSALVRHLPRPVRPGRWSISRTGLTLLQQDGLGAIGREVDFDGRVYSSLRPFWLWLLAAFVAGVLLTLLAQRALASSELGPTVPTSSPAGGTAGSVVPVAIGPGSVRATVRRPDAIAAPARDPGVSKAPQRVARTTTCSR